MSIGQIFAELGFQVDDTQLKEFDRSVKSLSSDLLEVIGIGTISVATLGLMAKNATGSAQNMRSLAQSTNLAASELQKYASVANVLNPKISIEEAANSIADLDKRLNQFRQGDISAIGNVRGLNGVEIGNKNGIQLIEALRQSYAASGLNSQEISQNLGRLGLPSELANMVAINSDQFNKIGSQVSLTDKELYDLADAAKKANAALSVTGTFGSRELAHTLRYLDDQEYRDDQRKSSAQPLMDLPSSLKKEWDEFWNKPKKDKISSETPIDDGMYKRHNPGNIRKWGNLPQENGFAVFPSDTAGFDAMRKNLMDYQGRGWNTIDSIVDHWSPKSDGNNNNAEYKKLLADRTHMNIGSRLNLSDPLLMNKVVSGISEFEGSAKSGSKTNVTIYNKGEVSPELWRAHELQNNQNTAINTNNGDLY